MCRATHPPWSHPGRSEDISGSARLGSTSALLAPSPGPWLTPQGLNFCTKLLCPGSHFHRERSISPGVGKDLAAATQPLLQTLPVHAEPLGKISVQLPTASHPARPSFHPHLAAPVRLTSPYPSSQRLLLALLTLLLPSWGKSSRKTGESRSSLPTSVNCRGLWLATWGCRGLLGSRKLSTWPNKPPVLCKQQGGHQERPRALGPLLWEETVVSLSPSLCSGLADHTVSKTSLPTWGN